ncbi:hypothetical protein [Streptomyces sp. NPDC059262]|uniref:hypothetical protein n=1 Tax=Streptomyces sp. NPDC059262 TaxID=3346797 RepID=UPI00368BCEFB
MTSAISVEDRCIDAFNELKSNRHITTVLYRLNDKQDTLILDYEGNLTHDELLKAPKSLLPVPTSPEGRGGQPESYPFRCRAFGPLSQPARGRWNGDGPTLP